VGATPAHDERASGSDASSGQRLLAFQAVLDHVFERFTDLPETDVDAAVDAALSDIGSFVGADRAYVVRYDLAEGLTWMTHEWCATGVPPSFDDEQGRSFGEAPMQQARLEQFEVNEIRDVRRLDDTWADDRAYLIDQGIAAILEVPLVREGRLVGVVGLDSVSGAVPWTAEDVTMLRAVAALFAQAAEQQFSTDGLESITSQLDAAVSELQRSEARFAALVDRLPLAVLRIDRSASIVLTNDHAAGDRATLDALGEHAQSGPLSDAVRRSIEDGNPREVAFTGTADGSSWWREASIRPEHGSDGSVESVLVVAADTTERHQHELELIRAATHDPLTGLPNRAMFDGLLEHVTPAIGSSLRSVAVLFIDLDDFKVVNDSLGHHHGDDLLVEVAGRLRSATPARSTLARLGGDEFAVLLEDHDEVAAADVAASLLEVVARPTHVAGGEYRTTASVGIAVAKEPEQVAELMRWSDAAMYRAKRVGRGRCAVYDDELDETITASLELDQRIRRAVEADEFEAAFQPVVSLATGATTGAEALVRWVQDDGIVPAGHFVPLAERNGTILSIGRRVLQRACDTSADWIRRGVVADTFSLAVNLSARQLDDDRCIDDVTEALRSSGLPPANLCLEITETAALHDLNRVTAVLHSLRELGVTVALDDFGTGYGSLALLQQLPVDRLKLDRSFIDRLPDDPVANAVTRAVLELGEALELDLVAEGVETEVQRASLIALGYQSAQGYLLGRPVFAQEFARKLSESDAAT
jgi:diguanylate cyclase (GGDEF)-like protein